MKLIDCLGIGVSCGLETVKECVLNVHFHSTNIFSYLEINKELNELEDEVYSLVTETSFTEASNPKEVLRYLQGILVGVTEEVVSCEEHDHKWEF